MLITLIKKYLLNYFLLKINTSNLKCVRGVLFHCFNFIFISKD